MIGGLRARRAAVAAMNRQAADRRRATEPPPTVQPEPVRSKFEPWLRMAKDMGFDVQTREEVT